MASSTCSSLGANGVASNALAERRNGTFRRDARSDDVLKALSPIDVHGVKFADFDNDGWLDLLVAGSPAAGSARGVFLLRNDGTGKFADRSSLLPPTLSRRRRSIAADFDGDGDQDLLLGEPTGVRLLRNLGGNGSLSMQVQLVGLRTGSGKNNDFGIGAKVELRAGEICIRRASSRRASTHFGLGPHLKADVVRIDGRTAFRRRVYFPGSDQDVARERDAQGLVRLPVHVGRQPLPLRDRRDVAERAGDAARPHAAARYRVRAGRRVAGVPANSRRARCSRATADTSCSSPRSCGRPPTPIS